MAKKPGRELVGHSGNDEIGTPQWLWDELHRRFKFTMDAAASLSNYKLDWDGWVCTKDGTYWMNRPAAPRLESTESGLEASWAGGRVFVNPPYSTPLFSQFIEKAVEERNNADIIVMLVKWDTSTANARRLRQYAHIEEVPRITYENQKSPASFASAIAIIRPDFVRPGKDKA